MLFEQNETEIFNVSKPYLNLPSVDKTEVFNASKPWFSLPYVNESSEPHLLQEQKENSNILDKIEIGLAQARAAIREARNGNPTQDSDYVPIGPMYLNAKAFHRYNYFYALLIIVTMK